MYQPRASAGLDAIARLCGFPGKLGMDGGDVACGRRRGPTSPTSAATARRDVLNTYLVYQRFRLMRGEIDAGEYAREISLVRERIGGVRRAALARIHREVDRRCRRAAYNVIVPRPISITRPDT